MDDIKLALLGNHEAARRLTEAGVLLPCPGCRGEDAKHRAVMACVMIECPCGFMAAGYDLRQPVILEFRSNIEPILLRTNKEDIKMVLPVRIKED